MKTKLLCFALVLAATGSSLFAQIGNISNPLVGNLNVQDAGTCTTTGSLIQQLPPNASTTTLTLAGTFSATITVRTSNNGTNWTTANTLSAAGTTSYSTNGLSHLCVDVTAYTSGVVQVTILTGLLQVQSVVSGSGSGSTAAAWKEGGGIIIPYVSTDAETMEESTWKYEGTATTGTCTIVVPAAANCWKVWHSIGWNTSGISYAECVALPNGSPGQCTRLLNGAPLTTIGTGSLGGRSRSYVLHQGATYYLFACGATCGQLDMYSSATGKDDWVLVQAAIISIGGVGQFDHLIVANPFVWVEGTTWKMIYTGQPTAGADGLGYATCSTACTGGVATWTKDAGNPFITADAVNLGGYGNADLHIVNGTYWVWAHSSISASTYLPSDIFSWNCGAAGPGAKPTSCTQTPSGVPAFGRQSSDEGASTIVGQVADTMIVERTDLNPVKTFLFYEADLDGSQQGGMEHLKYAVAEMSLASVVATNQGRPPIRDNISLNSLGIAVHAPPGLGMMSVGNGNSAVGFKPSNPVCSVQYMSANANSDEGGLFCNEFFASGTPPTLQRISTSLTAGRLQHTPSNANNLSCWYLGHTNGAGTESFPLQGCFDGTGNSYDILPLSVRQGGAAVVLSGTGACATITTQVGTSIGSFKCTGATGAATVTMTFPTITSATINGWNCIAQDETTRANLLQQTSHTATTCVLTATSVTQNDIFVFTTDGF